MTCLGITGITWFWVCLFWLVIQVLPIAVGVAIEPETQLWHDGFLATIGAGGSKKIWPDTPTTPATVKQLIFSQSSWLPPVNFSCATWCNVFPIHCINVCVCLCFIELQRFFGVYSTRNVWDLLFSNDACTSAKMHWKAIALHVAIVLEYSNPDISQGDFFAFLLEGLFEVQ